MALDGPRAEDVKHFGVNTIHKHQLVVFRNVSKVSNPRNNCLSQSWVEIILASWRPQFSYSPLASFGFSWKMPILCWKVVNTFVLFHSTGQNRCLLSVSFKGSNSQTLFLATQILYIDFEIITWFLPCNWADKFKIWNIDVLGIVLLEIEIYLYNTNI